MGRTDRGRRLIAAMPAVLYRALVEREALERWLPPQGMAGRIERFDPRPGGGFRMELTYVDRADNPGKTSASRDVTDVEFAPWSRTHAWCGGSSSRPTTRPSPAR